MNKYINTTKILRETVSTQLNSMAFNGSYKYATLSLEETKRMFVILKSSKTHYNKTLNMKNNKNRQNPKIK